MTDKLAEARRKNIAGFRSFYSHGKPINGLWLEPPSQPYAFGRLQITDADGESYVDLDRDGKIIGHDQ